MTEFNPQIFIGSSSENKAIAEQVVKELSDVAVCKIWYEQFDLGTSAYEDLVNKLSLYDYGILIATADDITISRKNSKDSPRDNVIFEFGLFTGRLGRQRSFLMAESGVKIPSDLNGITLPFFPSGKKKWSIFGSKSDDVKIKQRDGITKCCKQIRDHIRRRENIYDFGFLPSTSLAYGYYSNFVLKAVTTLIDTKTLKIGNTCIFPKGCQKEDIAAGKPKSVLDGTTFDDLILTILIPDDLSANMFDKVKATRVKNNWELIKIDAGGFRPFDFYIEAAKSRDGILQLSDIPLTLNALNESIRAYVGKSYIGFNEAERLLETREIGVFKKVLDYLISTNPITKDRAKTVLVDI